MPNLLANFVNGSVSALWVLPLILALLIAAVAGLVQVVLNGSRLVRISFRSSVAVSAGLVALAILVRHLA